MTKRLEEELTILYSRGRCDINGTGYSAIDIARQQIIEMVLKVLPKERDGSIDLTVGRVIGFNDCLKQVKENLTSL